MWSTKFVPGTPNWADLGSPDPAASVAFYTSLFGWTEESAGPDSGGYGFFQLEGKTVAAYGPLVEEGASGAWTLYLATADADETAKSIEKAGGTVRAAPFDVFTAGRMGLFTDPAGGKFALWQPGETKGLELVVAPGSLTWAELHSSDPAAAREFYDSVFAWDFTDMEMGPMTYTVLGVGGEGGDFGGLMPTFPGEPGSYWQLYVEVADCDATLAKAAGLGAEIVMPAETVPQVGRMAVLNDPHGIRFAIIASASPESE